MDLVDSDQTDRRKGGEVKLSETSEPETADVVVIGAGLAGLSAARALRQHRVVVLEGADRVGGRVRSEPRGDYWLNFGAHLFGSDSTPAAGLANELGLELADIPGHRFGVAVNGKVVAGGRAESFPLRLPLSLADRLSFARLGLKLRTGVARLRKEQARREGEPVEEWRQRQLEFENERTLGAYAGKLTPTVAEMLAAITERTGAAPDTMAAGYGMTSFAQVWSPYSFARNLVGGSARLPEAIAATLPDVRLSAPVESVVPQGDGVAVTYSRDGERRTILASQALVATPANVAAEIVKGIPADTREALQSIRYGQFLSVAVLTGETGPMPWDSNYAVATPGLAFGVLFNMASVTRGGPRQPGGSLMLFRGGPEAARLMKSTDEEIVEAMLADLVRLYPEANGIVRETVVRRWPHAAPYGFVGRAHLQQALTRPCGPIHFAGDYLEFPCMDAAIATAGEASQRIARALAGAEPLAA